MARGGIQEESTPLSSGVPGLDDVLRGGFPDGCLYLISGEPGAGKTTLAMQFLMAGARADERCLYITLSETRSEIERVARAHGWDLSKIRIHEMVPSEQNLSPERQLTVFNPSELELGATTEAMISAVREYKPRRVVLDSLSELRLIAQNALRYRRQVLALKQFFAGRDCTVLMLDDCSGGDWSTSCRGAEGQVESIVHGVVVLEQIASQYGAERRRLRVSKLRGVAFRGGFHDFAIRRGGLEVFPRLVASEHHAEFADETLTSGNGALDALLGGGIPMGTSTLLLGPAGTGKSTVVTQFAVEAAARGKRTAMYVFDENLGTLRSRSRSLGVSVDGPINDGLLSIRQVDPAELSPGEMAAQIRRAVDGTDGPGMRPAKVIVIDSLNGYVNAMPEETFLIAQLHELLAYLGQMGVVTLLTVTQTGMVGGSMQSPVDTTYLADNVILFRYFEFRGRVRRALSVVKKRSGPHEATIRELHVTGRGLQVGEPLEQFTGVLTGVPRFEGNGDDLEKKVGDA
ncbi:MAG TPA: ATPase domain-containing protein [Phycisphaerales bacterium]